MASTDQLTCHRVKECCISLHSCVQKWHELNNQGFNVASKLLNTIIQIKYPKDHNQFGALSGIPDLASSLEGKLIEERETLYAQLKETYGKLRKTVERMGTLSSNLRAVVELQASKGIDLEQPLFSMPLPIANFGHYSEDIFLAYSQELSLKQSIVDDFLRQTDRDTLTVYLSCWLHQPYIDAQSSDKIEAMLMGCGLRT